MRETGILNRAAVMCVGLVVLVAPYAYAGAEVSIRKPGGQPLNDVLAYQNQIAELWLINRAAGTTGLSAYQFNFQGGDFATGKLIASSWAEGSPFTGLKPKWLSLDQSLNTAIANWSVDGVTGSFQTPFVGPSLPINTPVLIGTFNLFVDTPVGGFVDLLLSAQSGIDDQNSNLGGGGLTQLGVTQVMVIPEPVSMQLVAVGAAISVRRRRPKVDCLPNRPTA